jgi:glycosyltransferase involved in cell wall biosynthesis
MENFNFHIITPVYNAESWISKCIESVKSQSHSNFKQVIVDDYSSDNTLEEAKKAIAGDDRFVLLTKNSKLGTMHGHMAAMAHAYNPESIMVHLDGDDWFSSDEVLSTLNEAYQDSNVWATYGNYETTDGTPSYCKPIPDLSKTPREYLATNWIFSQVRSFRAFLCEGLSSEDFMSTDGGFIAVADVAVFVPVLEMAGLDRVKYIDKIQMIYNRDTPNNDDKVNRSLVIAHAREVMMNKPKELWKKER